MSDRIRRRVMTCEPTIAALTMLATPLVAYAQAPEPAPTPASSTAAQTARGRAEYERSCVVCHGENLAGGPFAQPLTGSRFRDRWAGYTMDRLFTQVRTTMPPDRAGQLSRQTYADLLAYILEVNGAPASDQPLPAETEALAALFVPVGERSSMQARMRSSGPGGFFADGVVLPEWPEPADPLAGFKPVTEAQLENPPAGSWLHWRGDYESLGFSRLDQVDKENVSNLGVAW